MQITAAPRTCSHCGDSHLCATAPRRQPPPRAARFTTFLDHLRAAAPPPDLDTSRSPARLLYAEYQNWCRTTRTLQLLGPKGFSQQLAAHGFVRIRSNGSCWDVSQVWGVSAHPSNPGYGTETDETIDQ